jgi:hypothetical protein
MFISYDMISHLSWQDLYFQAELTNKHYNYLLSKRFSRDFNRDRIQSAFDLACMLYDMSHMKKVGILA